MPDVDLEVVKHYADELEDLIAKNKERADAYSAATKLWWLAFGAALVEVFFVFAAVADHAA